VLLVVVLEVLVLVLVLLVFALAVTENPWNWWGRLFILLC